jgi:uncharacterized protein (UPF0333 family)
VSVSWSTTAGNAALTTLLATYTWVQLHVGDPGVNGTTSVAVETDRVQATWGSVVAGAASNSAQLQWLAVAGTEDYTHFTVWTASSAGTFGFSGTITANAVTTGDTFTIPIGDLDVSLTLAA